jgi:hypothetical protein
MATLIEIKNISNPATTLDFSQSDLMIERKTLIAGATKRVYNNLEEVQRDPYIKLYINTDQLEVYVNSNKMSKYDVNLWIDFLAIKEIRPTKTVTHTDFVMQTATEYHLDWSEKDFTDYDLVVDISGGLVDTIYRVILPNTSDLNLGQVIQRQVFLKSKLDTQELVCRPFNSADDARVLGRIVGGGSKPTAHCINTGDSIRIIINREITDARQIIFAKRSSNAAYVTRTNGISSGAFGNPLGTNMLFNVIEVNGEQFAQASSSPGFQALNIRGLERRLILDWDIDYTLTGNGQFTLEAWLTSSGTELPLSRSSSSGRQLTGRSFQIKGSCLYTWKQSDSNLNFKIYRDGQTGTMLPTLKIWEVL